MPLSYIVLKYFSLVLIVLGDWHWMPLSYIVLKCFSLVPLAIVLKSCTYSLAL